MYSTSKEYKDNMYYTYIQMAKYPQEILFFPNTSNNNGRALLIYKRSKCFINYSLYTYYDNHMMNKEAFINLHIKLLSTTPNEDHSRHPCSVIVKDVRHKLTNPEDPEINRGYYLSHSNFTLSYGLDHTQMKHKYFYGCAVASPADNDDVF